ncbi:putative sigma-54 modulation protein [Marinomonas sp. MED121]|uniref:ribosome hibernation-promoting factor, HPF/YfiA family n=1 Tax=Marinomonas sp. MED121 TaxID=314277 RepID=UPI000068FBE3|nr:ribosome-associated translation inhibitor RaiA [Marinomonas sp. MED121]EAQ63803.1 putative sigma-54 modulation protein [Marinomonas sp. MED121]
MYTINITGHHVDVTPALKEHINEKMDKLGRLSDQITTIQVTLMQDNNEQKAEATIHLPGKELFAAAISENRMFHAIDAMTDKLARQIDKHKTRQNANHQKPMVAS